MVADGDPTVGAGPGRRQRENQQGRFQAVAVSSSRTIPSQGIDCCPSSFAARNKGTILLYTCMEKKEHWDILTTSDN